jgi:hypothetical protein
MPRGRTAKDPSFDDPEHLPASLRRMSGQKKLRVSLDLHVVVEAIVFFIISV